ncbi:HNH endonuclease family protein [Tsukamurella sp. 8F]|uniref:HNH endonuclease family protein n=1 Tax=unclassified Tsukamurella TaxID=2633480 RepID=UPI0023B90758|nr:MULTISPECIES: HNH endonuclease family protein [unclassified Tsukamurella]MDF0532117.1 HNH endonuclease family protein [Tsukamurella sp. 8J]MDF0589205.1 HNH endonuclease family protein [Tsukamurella sp. 8F]
MRGSRRRLTPKAWAGLVIAVSTAVVVAATSLGDRGVQTPSSTGRTEVTASPFGDVLVGVAVLARRERAVIPYRRVAFGEAWTDDQDALLGGNGCDTRNDVLDRDLAEKTYVEIRSCPRAVASGVLADPYTGARVRFQRGPKTSAKVQIDHVVALAYAWDMGAYAWDDAKRTRLANDPRNLVAVDGPSNENKRDSPPGRWMPANERFHCQYVRQFSAISREYGLAVDRGSAAVIRQVWKGCG